MSREDKFPFSFKCLKKYYESAIYNNYRVVSCEEYVSLKRKGRLPSLTLVNRVDIDFSVQKAKYLLDIYKELDIKGTFFIRLHAPEYNPFSFENYRIIKRMVQEGHEVGYHSEVIDQSEIWEESPEECLERDIRVLESMFNMKVKGVASHGGMTGFNNLDFWKDYYADDFGLLYEAYEKEGDFELFDNSFYISDSEWTKWKCYKNGVLIEGDNRTPNFHFQEYHPIIYLLIHSDTYYHSHFYE